jgi:hypothetical protein
MKEGRCYFEFESIAAVEKNRQQGKVEIIQD